MHSLHTSSHAGQEEAAALFPVLHESQEEGLRVSDATQYATPAISYLLVASNGPSCRRLTVASVNGLDGGPLVASACDRLRPAPELSARTCNALIKGRITTIKQFCDLELSDLKWLRNFGKKAVAEVVAYRARLGVPMPA